MFESGRALDSTSLLSMLGGLRPVVSADGGLVRVIWRGVSSSITTRLVLEERGVGAGSVGDAVRLSPDLLFELSEVLFIDRLSAFFSDAAFGMPSHLELTLGTSAGSFLDESPAG